MLTAGSEVPFVEIRGPIYTPNSIIDPNGPLLRGTPLLFWIYSLYKRVRKSSGGPGSGGPLRVCDSSALGLRTPTKTDPQFTETATWPYYPQY